MTTITGTVTTGITLGRAGFTSPLKVTHTGTVSNSTGVVVYAPGTYANPIVANQGTIIDTGPFDAVQLKDGGSVANNGKGALIQGYSGVDISGASGVVTNSGTIAGTGTYGGGVLVEAGGSVGNSGLIQGGPSVVVIPPGYPQYKFHTGGAVFVGGSAGTVSNSGTIVGTGSGSGVFLASGGSVGNSGLIQGGANVLFIPPGYPQYRYDIGGAVFIGGSVGTVSNSGTIVGRDSGSGVFLATGGSVGNTGVIQGAVDIFGGAADTVTNSGTITGFVDISGFPFFGGAAGTVTNSGTIAGGIYLGAGGSVANTGLINGYNGVDISGGTGMVTNSGTIAGTSFFGAVFIFGPGDSVDNTGLIQGQDAGGVYISYFGGGVGAVTNSGTIEGTGAPFPLNPQRHEGGVFLGEGGSVANTGFIQGVSGVYVGATAGMVTNSGAIAGTDLAGVILAAGGTVIDSGTITGGSGTAISFGGTGGNLLALENGYNLVGSISVAGTANTLELLGAAGAVTVDFDKPGAGFTNFSTVAFGADSNHTETLTITDTTVLPGEISGFAQRHDIVDLTQLAPKNATATLNASDQLVVSNGSQSVSLQLDPSENYSGVVWLARPDGSGGTDVAVIQPGDPAAQASNTNFFSAGTTGATAGNMPVSQYKGGASMSGFLDGSTPLEHFILAHGHGPPFG